MAYSIELEGRTIFVAAKAETSAGDYIVYEWNDGIFIPDYDDDYLEDEFPFSDEILDDDEIEEFIEEEGLDLTEDEEFEDDFDDDDDYLEFDEEDEVETAVREDMEAILKAGFIPQGGVSTLITSEYTTCYSQAFFRTKK